MLTLLQNTSQVNLTQPQMHCLGFRMELRDKWPHGSAQQPTTSFQRCCPGEGCGAINTCFTRPKLTHSLRQICHASPRLLWKLQASGSLPLFHSFCTFIVIIIIMAGMAVFLRGWLPHRGKVQMACNYCFPTRTMF